MAGRHSRRRHGHILMRHDGGGSCGGGCGRCGGGGGCGGRCGGDVGGVSSPPSLSSTYFFKNC